MIDMNTEAIRFAYGEQLKKLGGIYKNLVVFDADVAHSTRSIDFGGAYPERYYNVGISEANMVCMAAGMASEGFLPVVNTFSFLLCEHCLDQIRSSVAYNRLNVKFAANYGGLSDSYDGASHHTITDLSVMRAIPGMSVVVLSDAVQTRAALKKILDYTGPVYFRLCRAPTPNFHSGDEGFEIGRAVKLKSGGDITIIASGIPVYHAQEAAKILENAGIKAGVLEMHTIKPLDEKAVISAARETGRIITCEESNILGGLGGAVAEVLAENCPVKMKRIGIRDVFTPSGDYDGLLGQNGISAKNIADEAMKLCIN